MMPHSRSNLAKNAGQSIQRRADALASLRWGPLAAIAAGLSLITAAPVQAQCPAIVDGVRDCFYGTPPTSPLSVQAVDTGFGDSNLGLIDAANGSELNNFSARVVNGTLYLHLAGNLESNFNKLEVFFDTVAGGQNVLRGDNPNVDGNGLNRMGAIFGTGLRFDSGFTADRYLTVTCGGAPPAIYASFSEVLTAGGGSGGYLGTTGFGGPGTLSGGSNPFGIMVAINNSNNAGVIAGIGAANPAQAQAVTTGIELAIPLTALGIPNASGTIKVCAFVNGSSHDFVSNQVLGPAPAGTSNLGEPTFVNFASIAGDQFVSVDVGPTIVTSPDAVQACTGSSVTLSVTASGTGPLSFQWRRNAVDVVGATSASYVIPSLSSADAGNYDCVVTNAFGSVTSGVGAVTALAPTVIAQGPSSAVGCLGQSAEFSVSATGAGTLSYQWRFNGQNINVASNSSAVTSTLTLSNLQASNAGSYDCVVSSSSVCAGATSGAAALVVNTCPPPDPTGGNVVISQIFPSGGFTNGPYNADFVELYNRSSSPVNVNGWSLQYGSASGSIGVGSTAGLVIPLSGTIPSGGYYLVQVTTNFTFGSPLPTPDAMTPSSTQINLGTASGKLALVRTTTALGVANPAGNPLLVDLVGWGTANAFEGLVAASPPAMQALRRREGGCTDNNLNSFDFQSVPPAPRNSGSPRVQCATFNQLSTPVEFYWCGTGPASISASASATLNNGEPATLSYQWLRNNIVIPGATGATLTLNPALPADVNQNFSVMVTAGNTTRSSGGAFLVQTGAAVITPDLGSRRAFVGERVNFDCRPVSTNYSFVWRKNGQIIPGATGPVYTTPELTLADSGAVFQVTANAPSCGTNTASASATVTVIEGSPLIDGRITGDNYGPPKWVNTQNPTSFGDNVAVTTQNAPLGDPLGASRGVEVEINLADIGLASGAPLKLSAMISTRDAAYLSNQVLPPLPENSENLGNPREVDFSDSEIPGQQFVLFTPALVAGAPTLDGQLDAGYVLVPGAVQACGTHFGDNTGTNPAGNVLGSGGSELNAIYARSDGQKLYLMFTGNLELNYNRLHVFIDSDLTPGIGQRRLARNQGALAAMSAWPGSANTSGSYSPSEGMLFESGFEPDHALTISCGYLMDDPGSGLADLYVDYTKLDNWVNLDNVGVFIGRGFGPLPNLFGDLQMGSGWPQVRCAMDNSNSVGVNAGFTGTRVVYPSVDKAAGTEFNAVYSRVVGDKLYFVITGNLETNFNKMYMFFAVDGVPGQNRLLGPSDFWPASQWKPNSDILFQSLQRLGGTTAAISPLEATDGLRFDEDFQATYALTINHGDSPTRVYVDATRLRRFGRAQMTDDTASLDYGSYNGGRKRRFPIVAHSGNFVDRQFVGGGLFQIYSAYAPTALSANINFLSNDFPLPWFNPDLALIGTGKVAGRIDNSNVAGVTGTTADEAAAVAVESGIEMVVALSELGIESLNGIQRIRLCAIVASDQLEETSNQVLGGLPPGTGNLGPGRNIDFTTIPGTQWVVVYDPVAGTGRCNAADIAYDDGNFIPRAEIVDGSNGTPAIPGPTNLGNNGVTEADYNVFFANYFEAFPVCDIANDDGTTRLPPPPPNTVSNNGVTEGDYNLFFSIFFDGCAF